MEDNDIVNKYCMKCELYGKEFHYLSKQIQDCMSCYSGMTKGLVDVTVIEKYKRR
jgi:hypothetical protein